MDKTTSAVWHGWQSVARNADRLGHNASEMSDVLPRDMYLEMCKGAKIAAEISRHCQAASVEQVEALESEKGDLLAAYFCGPVTCPKCGCDCIEAMTIKDGVVVECRAVAENGYGNFYECDYVADPRTPEQKAQDEDAADYAATIEGVRP